MRTSITPARFLGASLPLLLALGCSTEPSVPNPCTDAVVAIEPHAISIEVGDTVLATMALRGPAQCRPITMTINELRWQMLDTSVARVSALKGYVVGRKVGTTQAMVYFLEDSSVWAQIPVTVGVRP